MSCCKLAVLSSCCFPSRESERQDLKQRRQSMSRLVSSPAVMTDSARLQFKVNPLLNSWSSSPWGRLVQWRSNLSILSLLVYSYKNEWSASLSRRCTSTETVLSIYFVGDRASPRDDLDIMEKGNSLAAVGNWTQILCHSTHSLLTTPSGPFSFPEIQQYHWNPQEP
jgi:hypothetical protein